MAKNKYPKGSVRQACWQGIMAVVLGIGIFEVYAGGGPAEAQDVFDGARGVYEGIVESKETRYKREQKERDELERQEEERKWREEQERKEREARRRFVHSGRSMMVKVEVFSSSNCRDCRNVEAFLGELGVSYISYNLEHDKVAEKEYRDTIGRGVIPATRIGKTVIRGFRPEEIRRIVGDMKQSRTKRRESPSNWQSGGKASRSGTAPSGPSPQADTGGYTRYEDPPQQKSSGDYRPDSPIGAVLPEPSPGSL